MTVFSRWLFIVFACSCYFATLTLEYTVLESPGNRLKIGPGKPVGMFYMNPGILWTPCDL